MPYWDQIIRILQPLVEQHGADAFDIARRVFLQELQQKTGRDTVIYAMNDSAPGGAMDDVSISFSDVHGMMAVMPGLKGPNLDIILHSGGGSGEAAKAIIDYLRQKFDHIRVIVPTMAMSAATMLACGADSIVLGKHSFLGPIDPQIPLMTPTGFRFVAAQNILNQFDLAKNDLAQGVPIAAWSQMLTSYGPDLLSYCQSAKGLSEDIVKTLLEIYMFKSLGAGAEPKARELANWLANHQNFLSHGRFISRPELEAKGFIVEKLEVEDEVQDLVLSIFHVLTLTFQFVGLRKIIENHEGLAYLRTDSSIPFPATLPPTAKLDDTTDAIDQQGIATLEPDIEQPYPDAADEGHTAPADASESTT